MDIFEATLRLKEHLYKNNNQLIEINGKVELSGLSPFNILSFLEKITLKEYEQKTTSFINSFMFDPDIYHFYRKINCKIDINEFMEACPDNVNTKEYWNFLHKNFPFCDVCSYYNVNNIPSYFRVKGNQYNSMIKSLGIDYFKNKKILEIGAGYGYLPYKLKDTGIDYKYTYADVVKRFDADFIDLSGYSLSNISDTFDIIILVDVIQHLGSKIFKTYTTEIKKLLKNNGRLVIVTGLGTDNDYYSTFFAQSYHSLGRINREKHMTENLKYKQTRLPLRVQEKNIGTIYEYKN